MFKMFASSSAFNQDLTDWCVTSFSSEPLQFATGSALTSANKPLWGTCQNVNTTATITSSDSDNIITNGAVVLTATFSQQMNATPTISITGLVTETAMSLNTSATVWEYFWYVPSSVTTGSFSATVSGTDRLQYYRCPCPDPDRQGIPASTRCLSGGVARNWRRYRRIQRAVRD